MRWLDLLRLSPLLVLPAFADRVDETAFAALAMPSVLHAGLIVSRLGRFPVSRLVAAAALGSLAPAGYIASAGLFDATAVLLWASLALASLVVKPPLPLRSLDLLRSPHLPKNG